MNNQHSTFQELLNHQIKIRDLQGRWRRVSSLSLHELEQLWNETASAIRGEGSLEEPTNEPIKSE